jgi:hypothetical protein
MNQDPLRVKSSEKIGKIMLKSLKGKRKVKILYSSGALNQTLTLKIFQRNFSTLLKNYVATQLIKQAFRKMNIKYLP